MKTNNGELQRSYYPHPQLRFVEREDDFGTIRRILQQAWISHERGLEPVWRDVPLEKEEV